MPRFVVPLQHRPHRDGSVPTSAHVPFYLAHETVSDAWLLAMEQYCVPVLRPADIAVVHVESDFHRELFTGELTVDLAVRRIGRRSFTVSFLLEQDGASAGSSEITFAVVDAGRTAAIDIQDAQRSALEGLSG